MMNVFDYLFEKTKLLDKDFLVGREAISFKQLYIDSLRLAHAIDRIYGTGNNIMLISANNLFFIKAYLAILKSGNICIPIDPGIEKENFAIVSDLTNPVSIFLTKDIRSKLQVDSYDCYSPDSMPDQQQEEPCFDSNSFDENRCAEIIFTSGSTGKPKGVMISHRNLISNTISIVSYLNLKESDRMLVVLPFYYCYGLSLFHTHLRAGGSIVFNNAFIFIGSVIRNLLDYKCTGFAGVPSHFQILLRKTKDFKSTSFTDLKYVTQAGGRLASIFIDEFINSFPDIAFYVMYGQTEATARLSYLPPENYALKKGSIGKGIPGVELKVVDERAKEIQPGDFGEVVAHGTNIMMGYYKDEESTGEVLKDGWLYTGDLGTIDEEGFIFITGRKKEIIKVGGKRISPKEIEAVILEIPEVVDCSIEGLPDEILGEIMKATIVLNSQTEDSISINDIKQHCYSRLASFKVPQIFEFADRLKISSSGKKQKILPAPDKDNGN